MQERVADFAVGMQRFLAAYAFIGKRCEHNKNQIAGDEREENVVGPSHCSRSPRSTRGLATMSNRSAKKAAR